MLRSFAIGAVGALVLLLSSCGNNPVDMGSRDPGSIRILAQVVKNPAIAKSSAVASTTWDSLVIKISAPDLTPVRHAIVLRGAPDLIDTALPIAPGKNRIVDVRTVNSRGIVIHQALSQTLSSVEPGQRKELWFRLRPTSGSIYVSLSDIPTTVDSIFATFRSTTGDIWTAAAKRGTKNYLSIDAIPDSTSGILSILGLGIAKDTLYRSQLQVTVRADRMVNLSASFAQGEAKLSVSAQIEQPGVTLVTASMTREVEQEQGPLVISEIMYNANDSEYVELHNPGAAPVYYDTLIVEIDGVRRVVPNVSIKASGFFVIGRAAMPWVDFAFASSTALDLSSTNGNWITVRSKEGVVMDRVCFAVGTNAQEWPKVGGKVSIEVDSLVGDPHYNNFGRNWKVSTTVIDAGVCGQYGTPRS